MQTANNDKQEIRLMHNHTQHAQYLGTVIRQQSMMVVRTIWVAHYKWDNTTLCSKTNMWPHFRWSVEAELSIYKDFWHTYYQEYRPLTSIFSFPPHLFRTGTLPWENCSDLNILYLALRLNSWFSQYYNTRILTANLSPHYFTSLVFNLWFIIEQ